MRLVLRILALLVILAGALWYFGEGWLAGKARTALSGAGPVSAQETAPLRDFRRIGMRLTGLEIERPDLQAMLPWAELWASVLSPADVHVTLPAQMQVAIRGVPLDVAIREASASARLAPLHGLALSKAELQSDVLSVDGKVLAESIRATATMEQLGINAPKGARVAYHVTTELTGLMPLQGDWMIAPGALSISGQARVWLSATPVRDSLDGLARRPELVGFESGKGIAVMLGDLSAQIYGGLEADAEGFAQGHIVVHTTSADSVISLAEEAGMIPPAAAKLARGAARSIANAPPPLKRDPALRPGEIALPLTFRDRQIYLGPLAIGPAPRLRPAPSGAG